MGAPLHATAVALTPEAGVLILGPSGAGKSSLALRLMALGARLVADDGVLLTVEAGALIARAPAPIAGLIEARGAGILRAEALAQARIVLAVDIGRDETERLPPSREIAVLDVTLPLVLRLQHGHLEAVILQWLKAGRAM
ncbi:serine kinase [Rhodobacter capsulatus]|uniref:HPr kinase/phosphorylase n=1 Tax=Rhodobacter capsulatus TaxID=1061 RepID=UPI0006DBEE77|nr:serine kinase [Rhodobacter capsulatus]KQB15511.1 serine kinase [Rhodobacter capsulatus]KQB16943.1 serine kinase [Rhodobacter capsulatus]QNR62642.1 serine kinase [Rhodobacter capsulatus]WER08700.1 serine kinase [Rhodobacter capsulatus]